MRQPDGSQVRAPKHGHQVVGESPVLSPAPTPEPLSQPPSTNVVNDTPPEKVPEVDSLHPKKSMDQCISSGFNAGNPHINGAAAAKKDSFGPLAPDSDKRKQPASHHAPGHCHCCRLVQRPQSCVFCSMFIRTHENQYQQAVSFGKPTSCVLYVHWCGAKHTGGLLPCDSCDSPLNRTLESFKAAWPGPLPV